MFWKTMKIIKLIGKKKYQIEQILKAHTNSVDTIIEIKKNVSLDKKWKYGNLNDENKLECMKTINFQNSENCGDF